MTKRQYTQRYGIVALSLLSLIIVLLTVMLQQKAESFITIGDYSGDGSASTRGAYRNIRKVSSSLTPNIEKFAGNANYEYQDGGKTLFSFLSSLKHRTTVFFSGSNITTTNNTQNEILMSNKVTTDHLSLPLKTTNSGINGQSDESNKVNDGDSECWLSEVFGESNNNTTSNGGYDYRHITKRMCKHRAVTNHGNEAQFRNIAFRLARGLPVNIVVFGGSVCAGHCIAGWNVGPSNAFPTQLQHYLNTMYPVDIDDGGTNKTQTQHKVISLCKAATGTNQAWESARDNKHRSIIRNAHMFVVDKGSNDIEDKELKGSWERPGHQRGTESIKFWTEALIMELQSSAPNAALLWVETAWRYWKDEICIRKLGLAGGCKPPYHTDSAHTHLEVLEYYDIPQINMARLLGPFSDEKKRQWLDGKFFCGDGYHPGISGHKLITSVIGRFLNGYVHRVQKHGGITKTLINSNSLHHHMDDVLNDDENNNNKNISNTKTNIDTAILPLISLSSTASTKVAPLTLNEKDIQFLESKPLFTLDFTNPKIVEERLVIAGGWRYDTDMSTKPKTLMTNTTTDDDGSDGGQCALLYLGEFNRNDEYNNIQIPAIKMLNFNFLYSYEGFGTAHIKLLEAPIGPNMIRNTPGIGSNQSTMKQIYETKINCQWQSRTSQISSHKAEIVSTTNPLEQPPTQQNTIIHHNYLELCSVNNDEDDLPTHSVMATNSLETTPTYGGGNTTKNNHKLKLFKVMVY